MTKRRLLPENLAPHSRYQGNAVRSSLQLSEEELRRGFWNLMDAQVLPETAMLADPSKQNYSIYPRQYYVDIVSKCRDCQRPFIFYAREQRYWFETLGFYVDANCVRCVECRHAVQDEKQRFARYSELRTKSQRTRKELMQLVDDTVYFIKRGTLKNLSRLGQLKNEALKHIPEYSGTQELEQLLQEARLMKAKSG